MKQIRLKIINLIDQHGKAFETCKGCPICNEIMQLRQKLDSDPAEKFQHILSKGEDMTKSDIALMLEKGVAARDIQKQLGMDSKGFYKILKNWGLLKRERKEGEAEMGKLDMTVEEFVDLRYAKKLSIIQIAKRKGVTDPTIHHWMKKHKDEIKVLLGAKQPDTAETKPSETNTTPSEKESTTTEYERLIEGLENEIASLQAENSSLEHEIKRLVEENTNLDLENRAMRQLLKLWI